MGDYLCKIILHCDTSRTSSKHSPQFHVPGIGSSLFHIPPDILKSSNTVSHPGNLEIILNSATSQTSSNHLIQCHIPDILKSSHTAWNSRHPAQYHIPDIFISPYTGSHPGHSLIKSSCTLLYPGYLQVILRGAVRKRCFLFFLWTAVIMKFTYIMGTSFTKMRLFFH